MGSMNITIYTPLEKPPLSEAIKKAFEDKGLKEVELVEVCDKNCEPVPEDSEDWECCSFTVWWENSEQIEPFNVWFFKDDQSYPRTISEEELKELPKNLREKAQEKLKQGWIARSSFSIEFKGGPIEEIAQALIDAFDGIGPFGS